jgi:hypothetical protein
MRTVKRSARSALLLPKAGSCREARDLARSVSGLGSRHVPQLTALKTSGNTRMLYRTASTSSAAAANAIQQRLQLLEDIA